MTRTNEQENEKWDNNPYTSGKHFKPRSEAKYKKDMEHARHNRKKKLGIWKKWNDEQRHWVYLAVFDSNGDRMQALKWLEKMQREYPDENIRIPSKREIGGLVTGIAFDKFLEHIAETSVMANLIRLTKSKDEKIATMNNQYLMDRAKGKPTQKIQQETLMITLEEQSARAMTLLKGRDREWRKAEEIPE